jgi:hypothetical protein
MRGVVGLGDDRVGDRSLAGLREQGIHSGDEWRSGFDGLV